MHSRGTERQASDRHSFRSLVAESIAAVEIRQAAQIAALRIMASDGGLLMQREVRR